MANIRVDSPIPVFDGQALTFRSPADCSQITGLKVYYPNGESTTSKVFQFADAHGNNIGDLDLFAADVVVKVILDTDSSLAFVQNADTNAYLEGRFDGKANNPNLLDNWYFADPINQRGQTEYTGTGYVIDRWQQTGSKCTTAISNSGLLMSSGGTGYDYLSQKVPIDSSLTGTTVTFSAFCESDNIITLRIYANDVSGTALKSATSYRVNGVISATVTVPNNATSLHVLIYPDTVTGSASKVGDTCLLKAAKLELSSQQTLAHQENGNWVLNDPPPDKGMELLKCIQSTADSTDTYANKVIATNDAVVSKAGDTMTGNLNIKTDFVTTVSLAVNGNGQSAVQKNASATADNGLNVVDVDASQNKATLSLRAAQVNAPHNALKMALRKSGGTDVWYNILHTGNVTAGTTDITAGSTALLTDSFYDVYE